MINFAPRPSIFPMSPSHIFGLGLLLACVAVSPARAELSLGELRTKFEVALEEDGAEHTAKSAKLSEGYAGALERLKVSLGREGKLEQAAQILTELEMLEAKGEAKDLPKTADYRFKNLRTKWEEEQDKLDEARRTKVAELATVYLKVLEERKNALTRAGEIRKALVVEEEMKRVGESEIVKKALAGSRTEGSFEGVFGQGNLALASNKAKAIAPSNADRLNDGIVTDYEGGHRFAYGSNPCRFTIELPELFVVSEVRLLLWDLDKRRFKYLVEVSPDGKRWTMVDDHQEEAVPGGWKKIAFPPRDVRYVRVQGFGNSVNNGTQLVEIEVYSPKE